MLMINITMLMITFVNSTISKFTSPANSKPEVQRQYSKDDGTPFLWCIRSICVVFLIWFETNHVQIQVSTIAVCVGYMYLCFAGPYSSGDLRNL